MALLTAIEVKIIQNAFGTLSGYVLDFDNQSFARFFHNTIGININDDVYCNNGSSKGRRFHSFLDLASDDDVRKILDELWKYRNKMVLEDRSLSDKEKEILYNEFPKLISRLSTGTKLGAGININLQWLVNISKILRLIIFTARRAYVDSELSDARSIDGGVRNILLASYKDLTEAIPKDFPASALQAMGRHISYCERSDMRDIIFFDAPDILEKAELYALSASEHQGGQFDVRSLVDEIFQRKLNETLNSEIPDYHGLILTCSVRLAQEFKSRTGETDDTGAIGRVFNDKAPKLMVAADLEDETNKNYQRGTMFLFQGFRHYFRNTHTHGVTETDRTTAFQALMLFSLLAKILKSAHKVAE